MLFSSPSRIHILVLALLLPLFAQGQRTEAELESYVNDLESAPSDEARNSLLSKFMNGIQATELVTGPALARRARATIDRIGGDSTVQQVCWGALSKAYAEVGQLDSAAYFMEQALKYSAPYTGPEYDSDMWTYGSLLIYYQNLAWHKKTLLLTDSLLRLENREDITTLLALEHGSRALIQLGAIDEAINYIGQALSVPRIVENKNFQSTFAYQLSVLYAVLDDQTERNRWLQTAKDVDYYPTSDPSHAYANEYISLMLLPVEIEQSQIDFDQGRSADALTGLRHVLAVFDTLPSQFHIDSGIPSVGELKLIALSALIDGHSQNNLPVTTELELAVGKLQTVIEDPSLFLDLAIGSRLLQTLAKYHVWRKDFTKAKHYASEQLNFVIENTSDTSFMLVKAHEEAHNIYAEIGAIDDAYQALRTSGILAEVMRKKRKDTEIARASISLRVEEIERGARLERKVANARFRQFWLALVAAAIVLATLVWAFLRSRRDGQKLSAQKALVDQSLGEKEVLLREIHHRVKNNLQIISSLLQKQARLSNDGDAQRMAKEGQERIQSMALIHENLYQSDQLRGVNIRTYLEDLGANISRSHSKPGAGIELELAVDDEYLDLDTAIPVGLILNELLTNAYKYAFPEGATGKVQVIFQRVGDHFELEINDNGIGLPADHAERIKKSLGHNLVKGLVRQLEGNITWLKPEKGTQVQIEF